MPSAREAAPDAPHAGAPRPRSGQPVAGAKAAVPGIGAIVAVASGKGGVGKSTTAVNLALGLQALGKSVGILDADIYGPSLPRLLGVSEKPEQLEGRILKPLEALGLKLMSIGFLVEEGAPMIWRGPMVISALTQMLREVAWGDLDVLVVDMPPGSGDAQLTMAQQVPLAGAVIVSTPQDLALIDARKGLAMFQKVDVPVLGIVENMSTFICPHCGERTDLFGHGGARAGGGTSWRPVPGRDPASYRHSPDIRRRHAGDRLRPGRPACKRLSGGSGSGCGTAVGWRFGKAVCPPNCHRIAPRNYPAVHHHHRCRAAINRQFATCQLGLLPTYDRQSVSRRCWMQVWTSLAKKHGCWGVSQPSMVPTQKFT